MDLSRKQQPTPVFLPGEFQGQTSQMGCSPWGHKESDRTKQLLTLTSCGWVCSGHHPHCHHQTCLHLPLKKQSLFLKHLLYDRNCKRWACKCAQSLQSCPTLLWSHGLPGSSVHGIFQARILEWLPCPPPGDLPDPGIFLTQGSSWPRDRTSISYIYCIGRWVLYR